MSYFISVLIKEIFMLHHLIHVHSQRYLFLSRGSTFAQGLQPISNKVGGVDLSKVK